MTSLLRDLTAITLKSSSSDYYVESRLGLIRGVQIIENGHRVHPRNRISIWTITIITGLIRTVVGAILLPAILSLIWTALLLSPLIIFSISAISSKYREIDAQIRSFSFKQTESRNLFLLLLVGFLTTTATLLSFSFFASIIAFVLAIHVELIILAFILMALRGLASLIKPLDNAMEVSEE